MRVAQGEIFGAVTMVIPLGNKQEPSGGAKDSRHARARTVSTRNAKRAHQVAHIMPAVALRSHNYRPWNWLIPLGGRRKFGCERENGSETMHHHTQTTSVSVNFEEDPPG